MLIDMWRTTKRENSTATPVSQPGMFSQHIQYEVKLKQPTSVLNPSFIISMGGHDGQNFVWAFGRYYWVTEIVSLANNLWEVRCKIDPLGSYRGHIRNTQAFVLYDSTPNTEIPDRRLGVRTTPTTSQSTAEMPWGFSTGKGTKFVALEGDGELVNQHKADSATGVYVMDDETISQIGNPASWTTIFSDAQASYASTEIPFPTTGMTNAGVITLQDMNDYLNNLASSPIGTLAFSGESLAGGLNYVLVSIKSLFSSIVGMFVGGDALQHVKSAYLLPFDLSGEGSSKTSVAVGSYVDTFSNAKLITNPYKNAIVNVSIPWQYSDWRNVSNTEIQLFIPLIGNINIPASAVKGKSNISVKMNLNMFSGALSVRVQCGDVTLGSYGTNCQMPILIGDSNANISAITNTIAAGVGVAAAGATGGASVAAGASLIASGFESLVPVSTSVGGIGGGCGNNLGFLVVCTTICHDTSDAPSALLPIIGTPTNRLKTLTGTGFCQTMQAHMNMTAVVGESFPTSDEVDQVNAALDSGVFLE